jgi:hypothetical protein
MKPGRRASRQLHKINAMRRDLSAGGVDQTLQFGGDRHTMERAHVGPTGVAMRYKPDKGLRGGADDPNGLTEDFTRAALVYAPKQHFGMHTDMLPRVGLGQHVRSFKADELPIGIPQSPGVPGCIELCLNEWADTLTKRRHGLLLDSDFKNGIHLDNCSSMAGTESRLAAHGRQFCAPAASRA